MRRLLWSRLSTHRSRVEADEIVGELAGEGIEFWRVGVKSTKGTEFVRILVGDGDLARAREVASKTTGSVAIAGNAQL